jgi:hypothetical protein
MSELVKRATYAAAQKLGAGLLPVSRSHLGEIHAALLGYATYAALTQEPFAPSAQCPLSEAQFIVLDVAAGAVRARALLPVLSEVQVDDVLAQCAVAITQCAAPTPVFSGVDELFRVWAGAEIAALALEAQDLDPALRSVLGKPRLHADWQASGPLWASRLDWVIEGQGTMREEPSDDGDDLFGDVVVDWRGRLVFQKAGRAGLIAGTGGATCRVRG